MASRVPNPTLPAPEETENKCQFYEPTLCFQFKRTVEKHQAEWFTTEPLGPEPRPAIGQAWPKTQNAWLLLVQPNHRTSMLGCYWSSQTTDPVCLAAIGPARPQTQYAWLPLVQPDHRPSMLERHWSSQTTDPALLPAIAPAWSQT